MDLDKPERGSRSHGTSEVIRRARAGKVSKAVAQLIVREIAEERLEPGSPLLPEQAMAERYGVGRASVREALRMLEMTGIVSIRQGVGGGPVVVAPTGGDFGEMMTMYLQLAGTNVGQLVDAVPLMEGVAAYGAASRVVAGLVTAEAADELVALAARPIVGTDNRTFIDAGGQFHLAIRRMLGNEVLELVISGIGQLFGQRAHRSDALSPGEKHAAEVSAHHQAIAAAIAEGRPVEAMVAMISHQREEIEAILAADPAVAHELLDWR